MESAEGHIELIIGPMFSGKSTELQRRIKRHSIAKRDCIVVKYYKDTRYSVDEMATHDRSTIKATAASKLEDIYEGLLTHEIIGIDEGQFFPDVVEVANRLAEAGKVVIISALDGTFQRKPFGRILELVPLAEEVIKLTAVCAVCGKDASFSQRLTCEKAVEVIGGEDMYRPVCRACFCLADGAKDKLYETIHNQAVEL